MFLEPEQPEMDDVIANKKKSNTIGIIYSRGMVDNNWHLVDKDHNF